MDQQLEAAACGHDQKQPAGNRKIEDSSHFVQVVSVKPDGCGRLVQQQKESVKPPRTEERDNCRDVQNSDEGKENHRQSQLSVLASGAYAGSPPDCNRQNQQYRPRNFFEAFL